MEEKKYHYKCRNNPEHLFEIATDDMWCPKCDISTYPMLEPYEPEPLQPAPESKEPIVEKQDNDEGKIEIPSAVPELPMEEILEEKPKQRPEKPKKEKIHEPEIIIGNQMWMQSFLGVKKFRNGEDLFFAKDEKAWVDARKNRLPAWRYPHKDVNLGETAGLLYNYYAVAHPNGLAPEGWDIPAVEDILLIGQENASLFIDEHLKMTSEKDIYHSLAYGTTVINAAKRVFWTKTKKIVYTAFAFAVDSNNPGIELKQFDKNAGFFVRCIRPKK